MPLNRHGRESAHRPSLFRSRGGGSSLRPVNASPSARHVRYAIDGALEDAPTGTSLAEALRLAHGEPHRTAICLFPSPSPADIDELATAWDLHPVLVEDLRLGDQRPKIERYGDVVFLVIRSAQYIDETEDVEFCEFHVLVRQEAIAIICQDERWIDGSDASRLPGQQLDALLRGEHTPRHEDGVHPLGSESVLYRFLDAIVDGFAPVLHGLSLDQEQIELQVFSGDTAVTERIYRLSREVIGLQHTMSALTDLLNALIRGFDRHEIPESLRAYLHDVLDHLTQEYSRVLELREALSQILSVNATLVAQRQNDDMKKISGWAAILFAPTLIGAIYGMNFDRMPELQWSIGYPGALIAMGLLAAGLYVVFKRKKWM